MALQPVNRYALKEWAVVIGALISGRQSVLFRKGGITGDQSDFAVEHKEFFLYSTCLHEAAERIMPEAAKDLDETVSISIDELGITATLTTKGKLLTLEAGRGLAFHYTEE